MGIVDSPSQRSYSILLIFSRMSFWWILSHVGVPCNERADSLACSAASTDHIPWQIPPAPLTILDFSSLPCQQWQGIGYIQLILYHKGLSHMSRTVPVEGTVFSDPIWAPMTYHLHVAYVSFTGAICLCGRDLRLQ